MMNSGYITIVTTPSDLEIAMTRVFNRGRGGRGRRRVAATYT